MACALKGWTRYVWEGTPVWVHRLRPDWVVPNSVADRLLQILTEGSEEEAAGRYSAEYGVPWRTAREHISRLLGRLKGPEPEPLVSKSSRLTLDRLEEIWLHITNRCQMSCTHCLFSSSPWSKLELESELVLSIVREAYHLGCRIFYATGGEPLIHRGFERLCKLVASLQDAHLVTLTNALAIPKMRDFLAALPRERFHFQVSLDGPETVHDNIRGAGSYRRLRRALELLRSMGFPVSVAMAACPENASLMPEVVEEAAAIGASAVHFLWYFAKGRASSEPLPGVDLLLSGLEEAYRKAQKYSIFLDNVEVIRGQVLSLPGTRYELSNAGWRSIAVGPDRKVYPTAALVLEEELDCGDVSKGLENVWRESPVLKKVRAASIVDCPELLKRPLVFLTGGGDIDHSWVAGRKLVGADPYLELYEKVALWMIAEQAGPDWGAERAPGFRARMGERLEACSEEDAVCAFTHSNCVLSLPGKDAQLQVKEFYSKAAESSQTDILNPVELGDDIPEVARSRSYGCGSPVADARLKPGNVVVDLGCGAGGECCVASGLVGRDGLVIGVDMLLEMLSLAKAATGEALDRMGGGSVGLVSGLLESIPLKDASVDVVVSNCVINLSKDKRRTFMEIKRVLKPGGRLVIADVASEGGIPLEVKYNEKLRGECIGGALSQDELVGLLEDVGFVGIRIIKRFPYRVVAGHQFYSLTYEAVVPPDRKQKAKAIYRGPFKAVLCEDGTLLYRGTTVETESLPPAVDESVFLLDEDGYVSNVDLGASCTCFVPPEEQKRKPRLVEVEGCMVCGAPIAYSETAKLMRCYYCGRELETSTFCEQGHFVCDFCHSEDATDIITSICDASTEQDLIELFSKVKSHPKIPVHGPEYHAIVPAVIVAVARNRGLELSKKHIRTAALRGSTVAGGACGFMGACGAALGVGAAFSVIMAANPYTADRRKVLHQVTIRVLKKIGSLEAARCCQRDCWIALREASRISEELIGILLPARYELVCSQYATNEHCLGKSCPLWPAASRGEEATLPVVLPAVGRGGDAG